MKIINDPFEFFKRDIEFRKWLLDIENKLIIMKSVQNKIKKDLPVIEDERSIVL